MPLYHRPPIRGPVFTVIHMQFSTAKLLQDQILFLNKLRSCLAEILQHPRVDHVVQGFCEPTEDAEEQFIFISRSLSKKPEFAMNDGDFPCCDQESD